MTPLIGKRKRKAPKPMHTHSSFTETALAQQRRSAWGARRKYDGPTMSSSYSELGPELPEGPRPRRGVGRRIVATIVLLLALALIGAIVAVIIAWQSSESDVKPGKSVRVTIPQGATASEVADVLAKAGVVKNKTVFQARLKLNGDGAGFRSGSYNMKTLSAYDTIVRTLEKGPPAAPTYTILFPEGYRITEMARKVDELRAKAEGEGGEPLPRFTGAEYLAAVEKATIPARFQPPAGTKNMEGFLFPATYQLKLDATAETLVQKQIDATSDALDSLDLSYAKSKQLTAYDVVNIAAMIEREAQVEKERPLVAAVIYNRLRVGELLGIDATIQYVASDNWAELKGSDLEIDSPYNSRKNSGLPPTPIANPGLASLKAAANPAKDDDVMFYVAKPDGSGEHFFTDSYDEFLNYQQ